MLTHEQLAVFFDPANTPYKERALITANGKVLRPDRFIITKEKNVFLLDYKTGQQHKSHSSQLEEYATCLRLCGLNVKQKLLLYCGNSLIFKEV